MEQRSKEWFKAREGRITGSSVGAILGYSPFMSPDDVMRRMVREYHGAESEFKGNAATEWGTLNEPGACVEYEMETGSTVELCGFYKYEHWLGASPDGLIGSNGLVEFKCPLQHAQRREPFQDGAGTTSLLCTDAGPDVHYGAGLLRLLPMVSGQDAVGGCEP